MAMVSIRLPSRASTSSLSPHALLLLLLVAALAVVSRHSFLAAAAAAADFEGFDSDDLADEFDVIDDDLILTSPPPPPTSLSSSSSPPSESYQTPTTTTPSDPKPQPSPAAGAADLWDEDEFEGIPTAVDAPDSPDLSPAPGEPLPAASLPSEPSEPPAPFSFRAYIVEIACVSFLICFLLNYFTGKRQNEAIALAWAAKFATRDSIFDKNFSLLGTGDGKDTPLLLKEGQDVFKFYASGRRYCQGMLATMELRCRHDLISRAFELLFPKKDTITFEVVLNDDVMDHVMLAIARKKLAKAMHKDERDLQRFATLGVSAPPGRKWVTDELTVISESKEVAGDLITDAVIDQVFGEKAFEKFGKWFISLHFSDQSPGSHKKILMFKFVLPDANNMSDMTRLVTLVPYYIDLIGRYKLSPHAHSKTETARAKAAQEAYKELQNARQEAMQKKKAERKKLMEEAEAKLSAEVLRKKEEKDRARQLKKSMPKVKMLRSH